jgi:hypothetical protein
VPTYEWQDRFTRDLRALDDNQRSQFRRAVDQFVQDLKTGMFRKGLRVKRVQGAPGVWEMTWADNGRATFQYGTAKREGEPHIIWRRVGTHDVFGAP